ncbi:MAG: aldolase [Methanoregula sp.]|uniref:aldolase n=1 Tax=Methanoregula sp. TaxID=2052170 RepID=UPI003C759550
MQDYGFERIGRRLFAEHLVGGNFGNISVRDGEKGFFVKRTGAYLDDPGDPVFVPFSGEVPKDASSEYRVHLAVYKKTAYKAIVHAHPQYAVAASLVSDEIRPLDSEGIMFCPLIPVIAGVPGTQRLADAVAGMMQHHKLVIAQGHGTFAGGATLDEAFQLTSLAEHACRVLAFRKMFR